jgi:DNA mismatch repair ATPase MutL
MFDIHAADERYNYERIVEEMAAKKVYKTNMLFPLQLEFSKNECMVITIYNLKKKN